MKDLQENNVPAENQNKGNFYKYGKDGIKILFVGNSVTKHGPRPQIGWTGNWGMAATSAENDYVHIIAERAKKYDPNLSFALTNVAEYERNFETLDPAETYADVINYNPDIIVMFFGANVNFEYDKNPEPPKKFGEAYEVLRNLLVADRKNVPVLHSEGFFIRDKLNEEKAAVAKKYGEPFISLGDIKTREETHGGYNHPSDLGMKEIADVFWHYLEPIFKSMTNK